MSDVKLSRLERIKLWWWQLPKRKFSDVHIVALEA
jgi:hypothetical protein